MPDVLNIPSIRITSWSGIQNVPNPLLQYKFQQFPLNRAFFPASQSIAYDWFLAQSPQTVRDPDSQGAGSDFGHANRVLALSQLKSSTVSEVHLRVLHAFEGQL